MCCVVGFACVVKNSVGWSIPDGILAEKLELGLLCLNNKMYRV